MNVLVLGGNGFIGSHVVEKLIAAGHSVRVFDRLNEKWSHNLKGVEYINGGIEDVFLLAESLVNIDVVFHAISTTVPGTSNADPISDVKSNLINTLQLLRIMIEKNICRIVFLSSGGTVYGESTESFIQEKHPLRPLCSYGVVKVAIENYLCMYQALYGLRPTILRVSNPYGERQKHVGSQGVISTFLASVMNGRPIEIWGDGSVLRDYIYVGDVGVACLKAIELDIPGVYNVGSAIGTSVNEILKLVLSVTKTNQEVIYLPGQPFGVKRVVLDNSRFTETFDWQSTVGLNQGIEKTWVWLNSLKE